MPTARFVRRTIAILVLAAAAPVNLGCSEEPEDAPEVTPERSPNSPGPEEAGSPVARSTTPGQQLYVDHCASCHGYTGRGDGPIARHLATPPRGLVSEPWRTFTAETRSQERAGLEAVVRDGLLDRGMPAFSSQLDEKQLGDLIDHVLSMRRAAEGS